MIHDPYGITEQPDFGLSSIMDLWKIATRYLVMTFTVRHGFSMALIEIDGEQLGLPFFFLHGGSFHGEL